ncbi:MAG TPA: TldD/PmbA family protein [Bacteroidota bacterium]|nr:TldD/PmbA family protein [Bacteroidota bacterium]
MLTEKEARTVIEKILSSSKADEVEVTMSGGTQQHLRFARNTPSTSGLSSNDVVSIRTTFGKRSGVATVNQLDDASLRSTVQRSEELARLAPEDPEHMPALGPQKYPSIKGYDERTARGATEILANGAAECIKQAKAKNLVAAGFIRTNAGFTALGNSKGLFGYHRATNVFFSETVRTPEGDGSGWVTRASHRGSDLNFKELSKIAIDKAVLSAKPRELKPGKYVTILEPSCVADMIQGLGFSMDARSADEGRSFFSKKGGGNLIGEKIFPENVTIYSDPNDPQVPGSPWGAGGLPQKRVEWITDGVLQNLVYSRFWAEKQRKEPVPFPSNIIMKGGTGSLDDLIKSTKEGVLVTSIWYIRSVDPRTLLLTGLTRDGVFWIENGKIAYPVMNFRWNDSPVNVLKNIDAMSRSMRVPPRESQSGSIMVPALRIKEFNFTSLSEAV